MNLDNEGIVQELERLDRESRAIREESLKMAWFMRGGLSFEEAMYLSHSDKAAITKLVEENMKTTKESGLPFF